MDIEKILTAKTDKIIERWLEAIQQDRQIESAAELNSRSLQDSIPSILKAIAKSLANKNKELEYLSQPQADLHGIIRAKQNFNPEEIAREFFLLRQIIIAELKTDLVRVSPAAIIDIIAAIDASLDFLISQSFKTYMQHKLQQLGQLQHQLVLTNQELTRLVEAHKDSFSYLTHEIKTPLTSILGYSDLFLRQSQQDRTDNGSTADLKHIEKVLTQGRKLLRIINDSLEFSNYKSGTMKLKCELVEICSLINNTILVLKHQADAKDLQLTFNCYPRIIEFETDSLRLQQILINLITNAIRYTDTGKIEVSCQIAEPNRERLVIEVTDTGIGIPQKHLSYIFEPYFRVKHRESYAAESRGIGLAIVAQIVRLLKGEIRVRSEVGVGSTFTLVLPELKMALPAS